MKIVISNQSELPIYAQIREQIKEQILSGRLKEGETLPSIRVLARELGVSVITTTRAYRDLEEEGYVTSMQGKGSIVLFKDNSKVREQALRRIEDGLQIAVDAAKRMEISSEEVKDMLQILWEEQGL